MALDYQRIYPATINTGPGRGFAGDVAEALLGAENGGAIWSPALGPRISMLQTDLAPTCIGQGMVPAALPRTTAGMTSMTISCRWAALHASLIRARHAPADCGAMPLPGFTPGDLR